MEAVNSNREYSGHGKHTLPQSEGAGSYQATLAVYGKITPKNRSCGCLPIRRWEDREQPAATGPFSAIQATRLGEPGRKMESGRLTWI